jgi:hypothetical protein
MSERRYQNCCHCGKAKPLTPEYWHFKNVEAQTFHDECITCRTNQEQQTIEQRESQYLANREEKLEEERLKLAHDKWLLVRAGIWELGLDAVGKALNSYADGTPVPHAAEMVEAMTTAFGGPMGIACQMANIFYDPATKQSDRIRILEMMNRTILKNTEMGGAKKPVELLTDEDIDKEQERVTKILTMKAMREAKEVA